MSQFTMAEILAATRGKRIGGARDVAAERIWTDSRTIRPGDFFVAIVGESFNGHHFVREALAAGAVGAVISNAGSLPYDREEDPLFKDALFVKVTNTQQALLDLARRHRERFLIPVVGITGSNGKTTTKEMTAAVLERRGPLLSTTGNFNNQIGVPLTLFGLSAEHQAAVVEMGINHWGELRRLCDAVRPHIGVITNIAPAHLEGLRDLAGVVAGKGELLEKLPDGGIAVLNRDDAQFEALRTKVRGAMITFGRHPDADVRAADLRTDPSGGTLFRLIIREGLASRSPLVRDLSHCLGTPNDVGGEAETVTLRFAGEHNVSNALAAAAAGAALGLTIEEIRAGLEAARPIAMRSMIESIRGVRIYNDAYNANPASMQAALETIGSMKGDGRAIAVLGEMFELGSGSVAAHEEVGRYAAASRVDVLVAVGEQGAAIARGGLAGGIPPDAVIACPGVSEARAIIEERAAPGDIVLIKGSRRAGMERILDGLFGEARHPGTGH